MATHKEYDFPKLDMYMPIQVGCALRNDDFGYEKDNSSDDNISDKNASFCELTALYNIWKSEKYQGIEYIGLSHYRRYFSGKEISFKNKNILGEKEALKLLEDFDVVVPKKRNYYIESVYNHYKNAHFEKDLIEVSNIIKELYPSYTHNFDVVMKGKKLHLFNMFIMKKELFDNYLQWLFSILFELEKRLDISDYDTYQARIFGFMSERLWNVWLLENKLSKVELNVVNIEGESLVKKAYGLLMRKYIKKNNSHTLSQKGIGIK